MQVKFRSQRDPRLDPQPEDAVRDRKPHGALRTVIERDGDRLLWESVWPEWEGQRLSVEGECTVETWRERTWDNEIVTVAEE